MVLNFCKFRLIFLLFTPTVWFVDLARKRKTRQLDLETLIGNGPFIP